MFQRKSFVSVVLASALALPAFAQDAAPAAPPADDGAQRSGIEEIHITARKVTENLQDTPISVSAINADALEALGIENTADVSSYAPNTYLTQTPGSIANLAIAVRGIGGAEPLLTREQGVAIYLDGAYIARVTGAVLDLVDVERVEVLRGPQGTLYGRNATGGAVNYISRQPGEEFGFKQVLGVGAYGRFQSLTRIDTGELFKGFAASISYLHRQRDGYVNNRLADDNSDPGAFNTDAFRVALGWQITEEFRASYAFDHSNVKGMSPAFQLFELAPNTAGALATSGVSPGTLDVSHNRFDDLNLDSDAPSEHTIRGHNLTLSYDFEFGTLKSITTYRDWENTEEGTELDGNQLANGTPGRTFTSFLSPVILGGPFPTSLCPGGFPWASCTNSPVGGYPGFSPDLFGATNERDQDQWSQELQWSGTFGDLFKYVLGGYYFNEDFTEANIQSFLITFTGFTPLVPLSPGITTTVNGVVPFPLPTAGVPFVYEGDTKAWALYGNGTFTLPVLDNAMSVSAGVRYSKDEKSFDRSSNPVTSGEETWDHVDWDVSFNWAVTEDITTYVRVATGYKSGGFNLRSSVAPLEPFDEEEVIAYEVGVKTLLFDSRLQLNAAGFFQDYDNLQTDVFAAGSSGATSITVNAGKAEIPGFELEVLAVPFDGFTMNVNYGYIHPEYKEYNVIDSASLTTVNLADEAKFGYKPENTLSAGVEYATEPLTDLGLVLTARMDVSYTSEIVWSPLDDGTTTLPFVPDPTPYRDALEQEGYTLLGVRFTMSEIPLGSNERAKGKVAVWGRNITDEEYLMSGIDFGGLGFAGGIFAEPATWGLDFTIEF